MGLLNHVVVSPIMSAVYGRGSYLALFEKAGPIENFFILSQTKEDMLRWIARCLLLHGVAPCELMGETERSLHINILFDLPWQADLAALATPSSPAVLSGGNSLGKWNLSFCTEGERTRLFDPFFACHVLAKVHPNRP
jgi:hypothetical protein